MFFQIDILNILLDKKVDEFELRHELIKVCKRLLVMSIKENKYAERVPP
jgi:hypothetical protein